MKIAIVDDISEERELLHARLKKQFARRAVPVNFFEYESGEDFLAAAKKQSFTLVFMDIYMNGMTGMEAAAALRTFDADVLLIFTTTSTDHAVEGFRVRAMHYLVKPYGEAEIDSLVGEIMQRIPKPDLYLEIKVDGSAVRLNFREIVCAEHYSHMIHISTTSKKKLLTRMSFSEFAAPLKEDTRFFLCSRGAIVNLEHVDDFAGSSFIMDDGSTVTVSKDLVKSARQTLMDFLFRRNL